MNLKIRRFRIGDEAALHRVFHSAVHEVACRDYTREQLGAWAPEDLDPALWRDRVRGIAPFVAEAADEIVGYADVQPSGYIDHFFVSGKHPRVGIGAMLMRRIHEEAALLCLRELTSDVSRTAEPFFARHGFNVVERREPTRVSPDHPILLGVTAAICAWPAVRLGRHLFGTFLDSIHDAGFGSAGESFVSALWIAAGRYPYDPDFSFRLLGYCLCVAVMAGTVYHLLLFFGTGSAS